MNAGYIFSEGVLGLDLPYEEDLVEVSFDMIKALLPVQRVRILGSGALGMAYAAVGWFDLYIHLSLKPWDVGAGLVMVREAGADVVITQLFYQQDDFFRFRELKKNGLKNFRRLSGVVFL